MSRDDPWPNPTGTVGQPKIPKGAMPARMLSMMQKVELLKQIASDPKIPSPPTVILQVLEKASSPDCTIADLCKIIQIDPGLAGRILRIVNSALFGLSRPATSIQRALAVVGINSARLLILAIALPEMHKKSKLEGQIAQRYWKSSISGAIVAHALSQQMKSRDAEDDMAAGLLRDIGDLVLQQIFPDVAKEIAAQPEEAIIDGQIEIEDSHYGLNHAEVSAFILERWRLPVDMTEAIRWHHNPEQGKYSTPAAETRAYTLHFATRATQLLFHPKQPQVLRALHEVAKARFGMSEEDLPVFLKPLSRKVSDFAALLQVDMGEGDDFNSALTRASETLVQLSLSATADNQRAMELTQRAESEAQRWREEAIFDPLTKVFNRRFFEQKLNDFFQDLLHKQISFGLLFIDLDGFKPLNDRFGHAFGDLMLQRVAASIQTAVRQGDIVARFGGDEFCVVSEGIDEIGVQALSQRVCEMVRGLKVQLGAHEGSVSASIGAVCSSSLSNWKNPQHLLAGADKAMYLAKSRGKNRAVFLRCLGNAILPGAASTNPKTPDPEYSL